MIERYSDQKITRIWGLENKFTLWQRVELAVIEAREKLAKIPEGMHATIKGILESNPIDIAFIDDREKILHHDLNSFLEERLRFLPPELQAEFHKRMTSYDTEEAPFAMMLKSSCGHVFKKVKDLLEKLREKAIAYRHTPMNARTHGQEAEMQSFGKRCLSWHMDLNTALYNLTVTANNLDVSKLSGAIGTNSGIDPELENTALSILGFKPWVGATQIMPRVLYSPIASALADLTLVIDKIANDIRLGARSGRPLWHEPFGKGQKGSSAMPHKKNTILCENIEGMAQMARHHAAGIKENIKTWEERAIAQSSVERVFWPDLFHVTVRAVTVMTKVIDGLTVYPDNMLAEIIESRGCYASNEAKEVLVELGLPFGLDREDAYRIVQLAAWNAFRVDGHAMHVRDCPPKSLDEADYWLGKMVDHGGRAFDDIPSIQSIILNGNLGNNPELASDLVIIAAWNAKLRQIFGQDDTQARIRWNEIFRPSHILANEAHLFKEVFGV